MMAPGALATETPVNLTPLAESDLSLPLPQGFEIVGAFNLDFDQDKLNIPAQLEIPDSVGLPPGTEVYFMRKGALPDETGTWSDLWLQEESGVVGDDGIIRTSSPPWPGIIRPGEYIIAYSGLTGSATLVKGQLTLNYNVPLAFLGIVDPVSGIGQLLEPGRFGTIPALSVSYDISSVNIVAVPTVGLPIVTSLGVQRSTEGLASFSASLNMPAPAENNPNSAPIIQEVALQFTDENGQAFEGNEPLVFLTASNALIDETQLLDPLGSRFEDLIVKFHVGEKVYEGTVVPELSETLGDNQFKVAVKVPNTVALGTSRISLARQQNRLVGQNGTSPIYEVDEYDSNKIRLDEAGEYVFAALNTADRLAVLEGVNPESVVEQSDSTQMLRATIPVGTDEQLDRPSASAVTHDGTRVYVTLSRSSQVALVDAMVLAQVDTDASIEGMNPIDLPAGSSPTSIAIGSRDKYAYIADGNSEKIYVLDINPSSATYHEIIHTISVDSPTAKLNQVAISSDQRKLFVTANNGWIYVINIDPQDRPDDPNSNLRLWHEQIGAIQTATGAGGIEATADPLKMVFTNGNRSQDANGFGVLSVTDDDPLNFVATTRYANIGIGPVLDYFDVNEAVAVDVMDDGSYAFVAGRNFSGSIFQDDPRQGGNIGIIKDPFGENPQLVAATRPIPGGLLQDVVLDNENKYLYAAFNGIGGNRGGTYVFDVEEIIKTLENPSEFTIDHLDRGIGSPYYDPSTAQLVSQSDFATVPIDDINPEISIAADYQILTGDWARNQFTYGVPEGSTRSPVGTGQTFHLSVAPTEDGLELIGPIGVEEWETNSLTPTFEWDFGSTLSEEIKEVNLFVSVFEEGEGLLPWDSVVNLSDPTILPNLTSAEKREFLTQPWNGYDDFNPNRVLTATWKENEGWIWNGGENYTSTNTSFTLDPDRTLTANQTYYWAVEAVTMDGGRELKLGQFNTPSITNDSPFSSVTILTHGFNPPYISQSEIPPQFFELAGNILDAGGGGLMLRYHKPTGFWTPVNRYGQIMADFPQGENPENTENYLEQLGNYITNNYRGKPLVLLPDWAQNQESAVPDSGFTEGAADAFYASLVQLDQWLGGSVGTRNEQGELVRLYDTQGNLIRQQGDLFNSPMHFIGFSRGTIVNSEILQRLLTTYPHAGGIDENNRDLHVTTIDPHDFDQPGLSLPIIGGFRNFYEPKVQMWEGITFADNYYQTTAEPNSFTSITPNGRNLPNLLPPEDSGNAPGLQFPTDENGNFLGVPDVVEFLGTRLGAEDDANSRVGFSRQTDPIPVIGGGLGATHGRVLSWYLGTTDLELSESNPSEVTDWEDNPLYRRRSDGRYDVLFDEDFYKTYSNRVNPWYVPQHTEAGFENRLGEAPWEGIGSGWFYSELGGGKELRPYQVNGTKQSRDEIENFEEYLSSRRVPLHFDNTHSASMRGDFAVPTLFNGNFDAGIDPFGNQLNTIRQYISSGLPGWSFHNAQNPQIDLVSQLADVSVIKGKDETDYAFKLGDGLTEIVHNRFVVPDWGALRFDVHVPIPARLDDRDDYIEVYLETDTQTYTLRSQEINLPPDPEQLPPVQPEEDINPIRPAVDLREVHPSSFITPNLGVAVPPEWIQLQLNRIGFGSQGFETFQVDVPDEVRGKTAKLRFKLHGDTVAYIDDVFFQSEHLKFGNPALNEQEARRDERVSQPDSYLVEKPQFAASYNESLKTPNWVSYQLNQSWINGSSGRIRRQESGASFVQDLSLPSPPLTRVGGTTDYGAFQRGHMTRAEDRARLLESYYPDSQTGERYRIYKDYKLTYLMSNIFPQFIVNEGRDPWGGLETYLTQTLVEQQNKELYVIAGRDGQRSTFTSGGIDISVPEHTWKVVLQLEPGQGIADVTRDTIAFAVDIPNYSATERVSPGDPESPLWSRNWRDYVVSINDLEAITGYDFLSNIPTDIQEWIEGNDDPDNPRTP
jgi:DNA/RNA endonuclease G (NUC1)